MKPRILVAALILAMPLSLGATTMIDAQVQANPAIEPYRDVMIEWTTKFLTWDATLPDVMQRSAEVGVALAQQHQGELEKMVALRRRELEKASR